MGTLSIKPGGQTKFILIDDITWIETSVDVPDQVARERFLKKWAKNIRPSNWKPGQQTQIK